MAKPTAQPTFSCGSQERETSGVERGTAAGELHGALHCIAAAAAPAVATAAAAAAAAAAARRQRSQRLLESLQPHLHPNDDGHRQQGPDVDEKVKPVEEGGLLPPVLQTKGKKKMWAS